jgi:sigma-B regulation protein RsbU (phosphoserine phosphatase)
MAAIDANLDSRSDNVRARDALVLSQIADLSQALTLSLDIEATLKQAVDRVADCMGAEAASVFLIDAGGLALTCRACAGPVDVTGLSLPLGQGIVGRTFAQNACQMVRDAEHDPDFAGKVDKATGFRTRTLLCAPLQRVDGPIGVLSVLNKRDGGLFNEADRDLMRLLAAPAALAISNAALVRELIEQQRIKRELELARKMQRSLLPKRRRGNYPVLGINRPAYEISGDFYDFVDLPDGRIAFMIGDVAGKGLDASLLMVRTATLLRWTGKEGGAPDEWLSRVNVELAQTVARGSFVCAAAGYYDPRDDSATWCNAGFTPALLRGRDGNVREFEAGGPPLGILAEAEYPVERMHLDGGGLWFFSDGVTDVREVGRETIGMAGARALIERYIGLTPPARLRAIVAQLTRLVLSDDTTLLLVESRR